MSKEFVEKPTPKLHSSVRAYQDAVEAKNKAQKDAVAYQAPDASKKLADRIDSLERALKVIADRVEKIEEQGV